MGLMTTIAAPLGSPNPPIPSLFQRTPPDGADAPASQTGPRTQASVRGVGPLRPGLGQGMLLDPAAIRITQGQGGTASKPAPPPGELNEAEQAEVAELKARDAEVHRHEEAHARAGGAYSGAPSYQFQRGPDGGQYAVGGSTPIDVAPIEGDPQATIRKMQTIKRAASAPAEPSGQDRAIAAQADATIQQARAELAEQHREEANQSAAEPAGGRQPGPADFAQSAQAYAQTAALIAA